MGVEADLFVHSNCGSQTLPRQLWKGLKRLGSLSLTLYHSHSVALICARPIPPAIH